MKIRDSGMPEEDYWKSFFDPNYILSTFNLDANDIVADFGTGYGIFSIAAAKMVRYVYAIDIESEMIDIVKKKITEHNLANIETIQTDFLSNVPLPEPVDKVLLFNILHGKEPHVLLEQANKVLKAGGRLCIIHWNYDPATPRGPNMDIRSKPDDIISWARECGFKLLEKSDFRPYHFGLLFEKQQPK